MALHSEKTHQPENEILVLAYGGVTIWRLRMKTNSVEGRLPHYVVPNVNLRAIGRVGVRVGGKYDNKNWYTLRKVHGN